MKNKTWITKPVSDSLALYEVLKAVLPKKGTCIVGIEYLGNDSNKRKHNLLIGANCVDYAKRNNFPIKTQAELDKWNSIDYREGYFVFNANGSVGIEGIMMNRKRNFDVASTTFMFKWITSLSYKGIIYQVQNVAKRSSYGRVTQVNNGCTKIKFPNDKFIVNCVFGEKGDKVTYCEKRNSYMCMNTREVLDAKYFVKKGSPEYITMKKKLNETFAAKAIPSYPPVSSRVFVKEGVPLTMGKNIQVVAKGNGGKSVFNS